MTHAHWFSSEIIFIQTEYKDGIKGRGVSVNELYLHDVNENMQRKDTVLLNFVNQFLFEQ